MILFDDIAFPRLMLFGCAINDTVLKAQYGFISQGLVNRNYLLKDNTDRVIVTVRLPLTAIKQPKDLFRFLYLEEFAVV